jgi:radical SAM superfamily enzyme YgiQ (UPF0313 family)
MKVLLIAPPSYRFGVWKPYSFHLGLGYVAAAARDRGHTVAIYDVNLAADPTNEPAPGGGSVNEELDRALQDDGHHVWREVAAVLATQAPEVVGVSVKIVDLKAAWKIVEIAKRILPSCRTVIGGPLATTSPDVVLQNAAVDVVVRREGEATFCELLDVFTSGGCGLENVAGVSFRRGERAIHTQDRPLAQDLDQLPMPAKDLLLHVNRHPEHVRQRLMGDIVTSRGCAYGCTFCANQTVWGTRKVRMRSPQAIVAEMEHLSNSYGVKRFVVWDDQLTAHRKRALELCERIVAAKLGATWLAFSHPNTVDSELLAVMKAAGCDELELGIESGSDRILMAVHKGSTVERIRSAVAAIRKSHLRWHAFFMIGFPSETREEMHETLRLMYELGPSTAQLSVVTPYPGTDLFARASLDTTGGRWLQVDKFDADTLLVDTMSHDEFRALVREFQAQVDEFNWENVASSRPLHKRVVLRSLRAAQRVLRKTIGKRAVARLESAGSRVVQALLN